MRLTRVFLDASLESGKIAEVPAETALHLAKVLRARIGDELVLFSGDGREYAGAIETIRGSRVSVSVGAAAAVNRESSLGVTLVQCVPRGDRMDFIVQKATELGVARIVPVLSQRSVVRLDASQAESKTAHWRAVIVNACEQCGRNRLPVIEAPIALGNYLGKASPSTAVRLVLEPDADRLGMPAVGSTVEIAVGPEGGFGADELDAFRIAGFVRLALGPRILRTETAAIAALTWLQTRFGDLRGP
jgi:16S rRNA (uracil1498-N3)-methyltransferase